MFTKKEQADLSKKIVNHTARLGKKPNPHFVKLSKRHKWLKGSFTFAQAKKKSRMSDKKLKAFLTKYQHVQYGPLIVLKGKRYHVKEKVGEVVRVVYHPESKDFAHEIRKACWKNGAHVFIGETQNSIARDLYKNSPVDALTELTPLAKSISEHTDFIIHIETRDWSGWAKGVGPSKIKAASSISMALHEIQDRRGVRWILIGWPFKTRAKELKVSYPFLRKIMKESIKVSFDKKTENLLKRYYRAFNNAKNIRIVANDGTDLKFSVKGRKFLVDDSVISKEDIKRGDVGMNIPCGEVFTAPVENSANGTYVIPHANVPGQGMTEELTLYFKNGRVVKNTAKKGKGYLKKYLAQNSANGNVIAELGIGCNRAAKFTRGEIIIDEKILGTVHVAIGWNKGFGGKTNASNHLDFIKDLRERNGKLYVNNKLTIDRGKLVR